MGRQKDIKVIQLFAGFDDDEIDAFVDAADRRSVPADHVFFGMGDLNSSLTRYCFGIGHCLNIMVACRRSGVTTR